MGLAPREAGRSQGRDRKRRVPRDVRVIEARPGMTSLALVKHHERMVLEATIARKRGMQNVLYELRAYLAWKEIERRGGLM